MDAPNPICPQPSHPTWGKPTLPAAKAWWFPGFSVQPPACNSPALPLGPAFTVIS